jgi:UDP-N-acetyl-2-amino-2-deoxyglucuronate dehydrogenase
LKRIVFALVGCGRIAKKHAKLLSEMPEAELRYVCDIKKERADAFALEHNAKPFYSYEAMLKAEGIDAVDICTPSGLHADMAVLAAGAGLHVVTEKPMALNLEDADRMIAECQKAGVRLFVVKQNRLNPPVARTKEALDAGRFGKLFLLNTTVRWTRPQEYYDMDEWRGTKRFDGGVLLNQASHHVDLLQWLGGDVESVQAKVATMDHDIEVEDTAVAILKFRNGALGTIEATTCTFPQNIEGSISILGKTGTVKIGGFAVNQMEHWAFKDFVNEDQVIQQTSTFPPDVYGYGHKLFLKNVVDVLLGKAQPLTDGISGRKSLEIIMAIYRSAETGQGVRL